MFGQLKTLGQERDLHKSVALQFNPRFFPFVTASVGMKMFSIRAYEEGVLKDKALTSLVFGASLDLLGIDFNYAYQRSDHIEYEHIHYFSAGYSF